MAHVHACRWNGVVHRGALNRPRSTPRRRGRIVNDRKKSKVNLEDLQNRFLFADRAPSPLPSPPRSRQFIDDVEDFMKGKDTEATLNELQTLYNQYKQIEQGLQQNRIRLGGDRR